jgi:hypothetical protein
MTGSMTPNTTGAVSPTPAESEHQQDDWEIAKEADCRRCFTEAGGFMRVRMFLCPVCGNKRCPKATDHRLGCTNSNEPGQAGSDYA